MTTNGDEERIRSYSGRQTLTLTKDGLSEEFQFPSIRPADIAKMMEAGGEKTIGELKAMKTEDFSVDQGGKFFLAIADIGVEMVLRKFPEWESDEAEDLVMNNFPAFSECITTQAKRFVNSDDTRKTKKLKHARKHLKDERK